MMDGTTRLAIDLPLEGAVLSFRNQKPVPTLLHSKAIENHDDVVCLVLSSGQKLLGSRDQKVCVVRNKRVWFTEMADVEIGDQLKGQAAGLLTLVRVIGRMCFARRQVRLVRLRLNHVDDCFVAEGVLCR